ncbi:MULTISPECIES: hypothetical protein [Paraburkholderia]|uniref:hypothetical protein n=1 Tax=Paraburkholderia TaxID=1822464 RepID=UPI0038BB8CDD
MSWESHEAFREIQREEFSRKISAARKSFEQRLAAADSAENRKIIVEEYVKQSNDAVNHLQMANWQPAYAALGSGVVWVVIWLLRKIPVVWDELLAIFHSQGAAYLVAPSVALIAWGFFLLRKHHRFSYAALEMGLACFTAYQSTSDFYDPLKKETTLPYFLAMMGSVYIAVRAYDNFDKWFHPDIETFKKLASEAQAAFIAQAKELDNDRPAAAADGGA